MPSSASGNPLVILWFHFSKEQLHFDLRVEEVGCVAAWPRSKNLEAPHRDLYQILQFPAPSHILHLQAHNVSIYKVSGIFTYFLYLISLGRA